MFEKLYSYFKVKKENMNLNQSYYKNFTEEADGYWVDNKRSFNSRNFRSSK